MAVSPARHAAEALAGRLPPLLVAAERVAASVAPGTHGRRRVGSGDSFWQYRPYEQGDATAFIDWRQTARSERTYIRETEWEAAQSVWLWADRSPSMRWSSSRMLPAKEERALLLMLALAALLIRGGERVGLLERLAPPGSGRAALERLATEVVRPAAVAAAGLPKPRTLPRHGEIVLIGDLLAPLDEIEAAVSGFAASGVRGHLLQVLDPAEESLPFDGRVRFEGLEHEAPLLIGRVDAIRTAYRERLAAQRAGIAALAARHRWSFAMHRTDQPPYAALLALYAILSGAPSTRAAAEDAV
jgi:uncharacterized protein (DUF58 family)